MKNLRLKHLYIRSFICLFAYLLICLFLSPARAQVSLSTSTPSLIPSPSPLPRNRSVNVLATVGDYTLTVSGSIAPYASVTLIAGDTPLKSTTADIAGNFTMQFKVARGFSQFCLDAIDIKRYGESYSCFTISPVSSNFSDANLYLPPTAGIDRKELTAGESIIVRGYGMPNSSTLIHLSDGRVITVNTDKNGFYEIHIPIARVGSYSLFANATLKGNPSVNPARKIGFSAISQWENFRRLLVKLLTPPLLYVWILLLIIILLIIRFISKQYSSLRRALRGGVGTKPSSKILLHHAWFVGY